MMSSSSHSSVSPSSIPSPSTSAPVPASASASASSSASHPIMVRTASSHTKVAKARHSPPKDSLSQATSSSSSKSQTVAEDNISQRSQSLTSKHSPAAKATSTSTYKSHHHKSASALPTLPTDTPIHPSLSPSSSPCSSPESSPLATPYQPHTQHQQHVVEMMNHHNTEPETPPPPPPQPTRLQRAMFFAVRSIRPNLLFLYGLFAWYCITVIWVLSCKTVSPIVWITALGVAIVVGIAANFNAWDFYHETFRHYLQTKTFQCARFFVIPFCVSSYSSIATRNPDLFYSLFPNDQWMLMGMLSSIPLFLVILFCMHKCGKEELSKLERKHKKETRKISHIMKELAARPHTSEFHELSLSQSSQHSAHSSNYLRKYTKPDLSSRPVSTTMHASIVAISATPSVYTTSHSMVSSTNTGGAVNSFSAHSHSGRRPSKKNVLLSVDSIVEGVEDEEEGRKRRASGSQPTILVVENASMSHHLLPSPGAREHTSTNSHVEMIHMTPHLSAQTPTHSSNASDMVSPNTTTILLTSATAPRSNTAVHTDTSNHISAASADTTISAMKPTDSDHNRDDSQEHRPHFHPPQEIFLGHQPSASQTLTNSPISPNDSPYLSSAYSFSDSHASLNANHLHPQLSEEPLPTLRIHVEEQEPTSQEV